MVSQKASPYSYNGSRVTYPVDLVEIIGQEYYAADNTRAIGNLHFHVDMAKEEVECRLYGRGVSFFTDDECGTL